MHDSSSSSWDICIFFVFQFCVRGEFSGLYPEFQREELAGKSLFTTTDLHICMILLNHFNIATQLRNQIAESIF